MRHQGLPGEIDGLRLVFDEQLGLVGVMRAFRPGGRGAEWLDRARRQLAVRIPFDELDEAVAMLEAEAAVIVHIPCGRGAQGVRTAIQRQIELIRPRPADAASAERQDLLPPSERLVILPLDVTSEDSVNRAVAAAGPKWPTRSSSTPSWCRT